MLTNGFMFFTVIGLLARSSLAIDCVPKTAVNREECDGAISQIVYRKDGALGPESKSFGYVYGDCSIMVVNVKGVAATRQQIEDGFRKILDKCKPGLGGGNLQTNEAVFLNVGNRVANQYAAYQSDFPFLKETCGLNTNAPDTKQEDCIKAYQSITLSAEGQLLSDTTKTTDFITKTHETCTVQIFTSDKSELVATNGDVRPLFDKMLKQCNGKSGVVSLKKGARGQNGRVFLKTRSSAPCGLGGTNKQVCY